MKEIGKLKMGATALALRLWAGSAFAQNNNGGNAGSANGSNGNGSATMQGNTGTNGSGANAGATGMNGNNGSQGSSAAGTGTYGAAAGNNSQAGNNTGYSNNANTGNQNRGNNGSGANAGYLSGNFNARVPQYWIADASIFIGNAVNTAQVLEHEQSLNVEDSQVFASQSRFMRNAVGRASNDLQGLLNNAMNTNPNAVPAIRSALAELQAAEAQSNTFATAASNGELGPTYVVTIRSALAHLQAANSSLGNVANNFGAQSFAASAVTGQNGSGQGNGASNGQGNGASNGQANNQAAGNGR